jgi:hypothetical protein
MSTQKKDLSNRFMVGLTGSRKVRIHASGALPYGISPDDALLLAAWLVAIAQPFSDLHFDDILGEVQQ